MATGTELINAGETLERMAMQFEGMVAAAAALKGIGSIENHLAELKASRDAKLVELLTLTENIAGATGTINDLHAQHANTLAAMETESNQMKLKAVEESNVIISRANATAAAVKEDTEVQTLAAIAKANLVIKDADNHLQTILDACDKATEDQKLAEEKRDAAQAQYDKILEAIRAVTAPAVV